MAEHDEGRAEHPPEGAGHHPPPSATLWPLLFAGGIAILLVGLVFSWPVFGIGAAIAVVFGGFWAIDVIRGPKPSGAAAVSEIEEA